jgi:hypothetical protein
MSTSAVPPGTERVMAPVSCSCSASTSRSWVRRLRTSIVAMIARTAPTNTKSAAAAGAGGRWKSVTQSAVNAEAVTTTTAGERRWEAAHRTGSA